MDNDIWFYDEDKNSQIVPLRCEIENIDYSAYDGEDSNYLNGFILSDSGVLKVQDEDGFDNSFYDYSGGEGDGEYAIGSDTLTGSKERVSYPFIVKKSASEIKVLINDEYEMSLKIK